MDTPRNSIEGENNNKVLPVFFKNDTVITHGATDQYMRPYEVCNAAALIVGTQAIEGAQQIKNLWRLYTTSEDARCQLLTQGISLRNKYIQLLDKNPYITRNNANDAQNVKITVSDIPLSFDNQCILEHLKTEYDIEPVSDIKYQYERTKEGKLTHYKNGNRFIFVKGPLSKALPRKGQIANFPCRFYHPDQFRDETCDICNQKEHKAGSKMCEYFVNSQEVKAVIGLNLLIFSQTFSPAPLKRMEEALKVLSMHFSIDVLMKKVMIIWQRR